VYKAIDQRTNQTVAIKFITLETMRKYPELQTCYNNEVISITLAFYLSKKYNPLINHQSYQQSISISYLYIYYI